jgi:hypothetical protein
MTKIKKETIIFKKPAAVDLSHGPTLKEYHLKIMMSSE